MNITAAQRTFEIAAVVFASMSGIVDSRRKNLDAVGAYVVALVTAFGGGTLRDVLLERRPLFWVARPEYPLIVLALVLVYLYAPKVLRPFSRVPVLRATELFDALALGFFGGLGTQMALDEDISPFVAVLFGVMTGTFGGVLRDVVLNEIPMLFRPSGHLYATAVFAGELVHVGLLWIDVGTPIAGAVGAVVTIAVRLASIRLGWHLPPVRPSGDGT